MRIARLALLEHRHLQLGAIEIRVIGNERVGSSLRRQIAKSLSGRDVGLEGSGDRGKLNPVPPHSATRCGVPFSFTGISVETVPSVCPGVR